MGLFSKGILGSVSGSVGPVVLCTYRGQDVMRSQPKKSTKAPVQSQIDQRTKFGIVTELMSNLASVIEVGYQSSDIIVTAMNRAVSYHLENAITGVSPDFKFDFTKLQLSNGKLATVYDATAVPAAGYLVDITWESFTVLDVSLNALRNSDLATIFFYSEEKALFYDMTGVVNRGAGEYQAKLPKMFATGKIHGWMFFVTADGKKTSASVYLGTHQLIA